MRGHFPASAPRHVASRFLPAVIAHMLHHPFDGARDGIGAATGQGVAGVGRKRSDVAGRNVQARRARLERTQHDAVTRQDEAPQEFAVGIHGLDRDGGADHHDDQGPDRALRPHAVPCADHRDPAVGAEARRVVIAVDESRLFGARHDPLRRHLPQLFHLFHHAALDHIGRHHASQNAVRRGQLRPLAVGQLVDILEKLRAVRERSRAGGGLVVQRPFKARIADVDGQESHGERQP